MTGEGTQRSLRVGIEERERGQYSILDVIEKEGSDEAEN